MDVSALADEFFLPLLFSFISFCSVQVLHLGVGYPLYLVCHSSANLDSKTQEDSKIQISGDIFTDTPQKCPILSQHVPKNVQLSHSNIPYLAQAKD